MSTTQPSTNRFSLAQAEMQAWYLRELRPKLALAVRQREVDGVQAAALDRTMRELLQVSGRAA
jgi:hypothetical protein